MSPYKTTGWTAKLVIAAMTIALTAGLLEWVVGGMMYPDPATVATRKQTGLAPWVQWLYLSTRLSRLRPSAMRWMFFSYV